MKPVRRCPCCGWLRYATAFPAGPKVCSPCIEGTVPEPLPLLPERPAAKTLTKLKPLTAAQRARQHARMKWAAIARANAEEAEHGR